MTILLSSILFSLVVSSSRHTSSRRLEREQSAVAIHRRGTKRKERHCFSRLLSKLSSVILVVPLVDPPHTAHILTLLELGDDAIAVGVFACRRRMAVEEGVEADFDGEVEERVGWEMATASFVAAGGEGGEGGRREDRCRQRSAAGRKQKRKETETHSEVVTRFPSTGSQTVFLVCVLSRTFQPSVSAVDRRSL
jgi:hypothetical protein